MKAYLTGEVYWTEELVKLINEAQEDVDLIVNSPGGDVFEGLQVVNAIQNCPHNVTAHVEVISASIAAVITLACDKVTIRKDDLFLLHNCWTWAVGNKEELQEQIEVMEKIDTVLHDIISEHCKDPEAVTEKMNDGDYWLLGDEVAELFDNCELIEKPSKQNSIAAYGGFGKLVNMARKAEEAKPEPYVMSNELKELLAYDE